MKSIMDLKNERVARWEQAKEFLEKNRDPKTGLVNAAAVERFNGMVDIIRQLADEITRREKMEEMDREIYGGNTASDAKAVITLNQRGSADNAITSVTYTDAFSNMIRGGGNIMEVKAALSFGVNKEGGYTVSDGISGTGTKKRNGFMDMIQACEEGRVDLVITKSVSRFARNTQDSLNYSRKLKALGIPIIFEKENVNTMDSSGELMFTILSSLAQEESRNISENTAWGIRSKFQRGIPHINCESLLGYDKDADGNLVINEEQAEVVRRIYRDFLEGWTVSEISRRLNAEGVCGVHGKASWFPVTIERVLRNEKHVGDLLMQKTYTSDYLTKKQTENNGELEQYYVKDDHPGIIRREEWDAVQLELERREAFRERHGIHTAGSSNDDPLYSRVFCGTCGGKLVRKNWKGNRQPFWKCENAEKKKGHTCKAENVKEADLKQAIVIAWNSLVEKRSEKVAEWQRQAAEGNALERYRARLMLAVTEDGPLEAEVPELTRMFLEEIVVHTPTEMTVGFLDGSRVKVRL